MILLRSSLYYLIDARIPHPNAPAALTVENKLLAGPIDSLALLHPRRFPYIKDFLNLRRPISPPFSPPLPPYQCYQVYWYTLANSFGDEP